MKYYFFFGNRSLKKQIELIKKKKHFGFGKEKRRKGSEQ